MAAPPSDQHLRPYRLVSWLAYLVMAVGFSSLVIFSVTKSVFSMTPERPGQVEALTESQCAERLQVLFVELDTERKSMGDTTARGADQRWLTFRNGWVGRSATLEAQCSLSDPARQPLKRAFGLLAEVMDLSTIQSAQFEAQMGPTLDSLRDQLKALRPEAAPQPGATPQPQGAPPATR
jgi:hypothetical protein